MADREHNPENAVDRVDRWLDARSRWIVLAVIVASVALRVAYFAQLSGGPLMVQHLWADSDMNHFDRWARDIVAGDVLSARVELPLHTWHRIVARDWYAMHPDELRRLEREAGAEPAPDTAARALWERWLGGGRLFQDPLYPYLVAATYAVAGPDVRWVFLWQLALGVLTNVLVFLVARRCFGALAGTLAAAIATFYAPAMFYEMLLLRDSLVVFVSLALAWIVGRRFAAGLALGLAMLLKVHFALLAAIALAVAGAAAWRRPAEWKRTVLPLAAGLALGFAPVVVRAAVLRVPLTVTGSIPAIVTHNGPLATGTRWDVQNAARILDEADGRFFAAGIAAARAHGSLSGFARLQAEKVATLVHGYELPNNENFYYYALHAPVLRWMPFTFAFVAPLGFVGLALGLRAWRRAWPLYVVALVNVTATLLLLPYSRYRIPFAVALIPFAGMTLAAVARWIVSRRFGPAAVAAAAVAAIAIWSASPLPASMTPIRATDCGVPVVTWYRPRIDAAFERGDRAEVTRLMAELLRVEPAAATEMGQGRAARNGDERELARLYADLWLRYAGALGSAGREDEAAAARARAARFRLASGG